MRNHLLPLVLGCSAAVAVSAGVASLNENIAVSATAAPDYHREMEGTASLRPQTYVFSPGKFIESGTRDRGLESASFTELARTLAPNLVKQKYYPTKDVAAADLLIVVHWGATLIHEDPQRDNMISALGTELPAYNAAIAENGSADSAAMNHISDSLAWAQDNADRALARNAVLLGYARSLKKYNQRSGYQTEEEKILVSELTEERYFVVLMAYDNQALRKEKKSKLLWVTRLSVRTPGNNFTEALPVLSQAGSHVFGRQLDDLVHLKANLREGRVSLGEMKFLGEVEMPPPEKKTP